MPAVVEPLRDPDQRLSHNRNNHKHQQLRQDQTSHSLRLSARPSMPRGTASTERRVSPSRLAKKFSTIASKFSP